MTAPRSMLAAFAAAVALVAAPIAHAQDKPAKLTILAHKVMQTVATGAAGDITKEWRERTGVGVDWLTFDTGPLHERMMREASLGESSIDLVFMLNTYAVPRISKLFEPLDDLMKQTPLEDPQDIFPGLQASMRFDGKTYGIPFRHATSGLHYNAALFAERGIAEPPRTMEEFVEVAKKMSYTRPDGTQVFGFVITGDNYANVVDIARGWNGDFITQDYKVAANQPPMVKAIQTLADFYKGGVLPKNYAVIKTEEVNTWMQTGRAAMTITSFGRTSFYNDKDKSKFPGQIKVTTMPIGTDLKGSMDVAPVKTEFWAIAIPANSKHKQLAWSLAAEMLSKPNTLKAALNGNGPVRASTYQSAEFTKTLPYAPDEARVLKVARPPLPAFDNAAKAGDIFVEEMQSAVLGMKAPQKAMDDVTQRVTPLVQK